MGKALAKSMTELFITIALIIAIEIGFHAYFSRYDR